MPKRNRSWYLGLVGLVIALGLLARAGSSHLPEVVNVYLGDALYALTIHLGFGALLPTQSPLRVGALALLFCWGIEVSQLYHAPWIDAIRSTRIGGLVLGFGFLWSDILAYALGVLSGSFLERLELSRGVPPPTTSQED